MGKTVLENNEKAALMVFSKNHGDHDGLLRNDFSQKLMGNGIDARSESGMSTNENGVPMGKFQE